MVKKLLPIALGLTFCCIINQCPAQPVNKFKLFEEKEAQLEKVLLWDVRLYEESELFKYHWDSSYQYAFNQLPEKNKIHKIRHVRFNRGISQAFAKEISEYPFLISVQIDECVSLRGLKNGLKALNKSTSIKYLFIKQDQKDSFYLDKEVFTLISRFKNLEALFIKGKIDLIDSDYKFPQSLIYLSLQTSSKKLVIKSGFNRYPLLNCVIINHVFHKGAELVFHKDVNISKSLRYLGIHSPLNNKNSLLPAFEKGSRLTSLTITGSGYVNELNLSNCTDLKILKIYGNYIQIAKNMTGNFDSLKYVMIKIFAGKAETGFLSKANNINYLYLWGCFDNLIVNLNKHSSIFTFRSSCQLEYHEIKTLEHPDSLFLSIENYSSIDNLLTLIQHSSGLYFEDISAETLERLLNSVKWNAAALKEIYLPGSAFQIENIELLKQLKPIKNLYFFNVDNKTVDPKVFTILPQLKYLRDD